MPTQGSPSVALRYDADIVHAQLERILGSHHFRNSKRSQALLRFVVDTAVTGDLNSLKERCIGAAVFGRDTAYDTAQDPIVRNAAVDVRKRLAQYYLEPQHLNELRIDLPAGSYLPTIASDAAVAEEAPKPAPAAHVRSLRWKGVLGLLIVVGAAAAFAWTLRRTAATELNAFWEPIFRDGKPIQICIGQPTRLYRFVGPRSEELNSRMGGPPSARNAAGISIAPDELAWVAPEYLFQRDSLAGFRIASWIQAKGGTSQLMSVTDTSYARLRHAPLVAIGAFNNQWAMRVTADLRFEFNRRTINGVTYDCIDDRRDPAAVHWRVPQPVTGRMTEDYAIVTRVFDPATEKTVISAAGIESYGTQAASEFVTQPEYLGAALLAAPRDWRHRNAQFVLGTKIIDDTPGPPRVLAAHFW